jgi:hypothetical protein
MMPRAKDGTFARHASSLSASWLLLLGTAALSIASGCGGGEKASGVAQSTLPEGLKSEALDHEACNESGHRVETLDTNNDGKPDIKRLYDTRSNQEVCRITDLDHDGKPDLWEYYDPSGVLRRREAGYNGTGVVDVIEIYENGKLAKRELDTTGQHRVDTWDFFDPATGKIARRERDSTNDGRVDQWWTYDGDKVTIAMDTNGDGKPDPTETVTIGGDEAAKTAPAAAPIAQDAPPPAPAPYVPAGMAGMDAGDVASVASDAGSAAAWGVDAGAKPGKSSKATGKGSSK